MPALQVATVTLGTTDWIVVALYLALLAASGWLLSRRQSDAEDYHLAGRSMPAWAVAVSVLATALSAATFIGGPQYAYALDLTYIFSSVGSILAAIIVAFVFLPAFYRHRVTTVYDILDRRFGPAARTAGSVTFMLGRLLASGARVYIAAHALAYVMTGSATDPDALVVAVIILAAAGVLYTVGGGIATVIWTDAVQLTVLLGAVLVGLVILVNRIDLPPAEIIAFLRDGASDPDAPSKLRVVNPSLDFSQAHTLWSAIIAWTLFNVAAYGADQDLAQRLLTCRTRAKASWSMISSVLLSLPVTLIFMTIGLLLYVRENHPAVSDGGQPKEGVKAFLAFITTDMPPGVGGAMIAGLFAAGLSSLDSALNALSSTFLNDIYRPIRGRVGKREELLVARLGVVGWGVALAAVACLCVYWRRGSEQTLIDFALSVMIYAYAGLLAVFAAAILTKRGRSWSAIAALITGVGVVLLTEPAINRPVASLFSGEPITLTYPWRLALATTLAFIVCILPRGSTRRDAIH